MTAYRNIYQDLPRRVKQLWARLENCAATDSEDFSVTAMLMAAATGLAMPFETLRDLGAGRKKDWNHHPAFQGADQNLYNNSLQACEMFLKKPISECAGLKSCELMVCRNLKDIRETAEQPDQAHIRLEKGKTKTRQALNVLRNALAHNNIVDLPGSNRQIEKLVFFSRNNWCSDCQRMDGWNVLVITVNDFKLFLDAWFELRQNENSYLGAAKAIAGKR